MKKGNPLHCLLQHHSIHQAGEIFYMWMTAIIHLMFVFHYYLSNKIN